jgi:phage terminase large subunit
MPEPTKLRVEVPRAFSPLLKPARYKGAHGGRGSGKSHFFAEQVVLLCYRQTTRVACIREVQNTIRDSVRQLLIDKIQKFGLGTFFEVTDTEIRGKNGSLVIFRGMQSFNAESIKSLEGFDIAWVEEAQTLSDLSLRMLRPTIRNEGSELLFSWNPRHDTDAVDQFLRGARRPKDAIVVEVNWNDNPWFPDVLKREKDEDYAADPEMAEHVWGGGYEIVSEGSYYARAIIDAERDGRVGYFPYNPKAPVKTAWDIGVDDYTAVWFVQDDGLKATVIDYYEASGEGADDVVSTCMPELFRRPANEAKFAEWTMAQALENLQRSEPFKYGTCYFPHDVKAREWGAGARSRVETLVSFGVNNIARGVATNPSDRITAVRKLMPIVRFHKTPRVELGLKRLRRYRRKWNDALQTYTTPEHDENSHGADAFGEYAINCGIYPPPPPKKPFKVDTRQPTLNEIIAEHERNNKLIGNRI